MPETATTLPKAYQDKGANRMSEAELNPEALADLVAALEDAKYFMQHRMLNAEASPAFKRVIAALRKAKAKPCR